MVSGVSKSLVIALMALFLSACGFTPLYDSSTTSGPSSTKVAPAEFAQISFSAPSDRASQIIFRELGFRLNSGGVKTYRLDVNVTKKSRRITTTTSDNPREANIANLEAHFVLRRIQDEAIIVDERRFAQATFNTTGQGVADEQAAVNAEERAARTLAELIRARLVAVLSQDEITPLKPKGEEITIIRQ